MNWRRHEDGYRSTVNEIRFADGLILDYSKLKVLTQNNAPTVATPVPDQTVSQGVAFSYAVPATSFADADAGDTLTYKATLSTGCG